ncbi:hypothetical protein GCM10009555_071280 [Acrocarpospora macrocephala]|uniref:CopC domain-containing protein n=1 Tax=Acrocarpospora macrocephala TaxID=150177 RepID=A0A5M3WJ95_9ACTN|nr:copper resistance CopC family protein [Acrocarpospora macrocephala]GES08726.1 hypothetical protein Amac_023220 [Acrocarpospora macrocephala]
MFLRRSMILLSAAAALLGTAMPAQAHDALKSSNPAKNAKVEAIDQVVLEFTNAVRFPKVIVTDAAGKSFQQGEADLKGKTVTQRVTTPLPPGKYTIAYRVVSSDGHPRTGEVPFTVTPSPTPTTSPSPPPSESASPSPAAATSAPPLATPSAEPVAATSGGASSMTVWILVGVGALVVVTVFVLTGRKRRPSD